MVGRIHSGRQFTRSLLLTFVAVIALTLGLSPVAVAQTWPNKPVKFFIPLGPGSGADVTARLVADRLQAKWAQPVVVENRPGGDAMLAIGAFITADDDHTFLFAPSGTFTAHPYLHAKLSYDPTKLIPVVRVSNTIIAVGVPTSLGIATLAEFFAAVKSKPGQLNRASATGLNDMQFDAYMKGNGLDVARVPYRDPTQAATDLAEGRIQIYVAAYGIMRPFVQGDKVRVIALTNTSRAPQLKDVPTTREAGFPSLEVDGLVGLFALPSVTTGLREKIAADVMAVLAEADIAERIANTGQVVNPGGPAAFAAAIEQQKLVAAETAKLLGLKPGQ